MARRAEAAGWQGFFLWDHLQWPGIEPSLDPWVTLGAIAARTEHLRLGPLVTPVPRRHTAKLAREVLTLDHLSGGRAVLGVGAGAGQLPEYTAFGDEADPRTRADLLDEGLELLSKMLSGEPLDHQGEHLRAQSEPFGPPRQTPRVPIWVAATWPHRRPFRRAARWDGVVPMPEAMEPLSADDVHDIVAYVDEHRTSETPFEVVFFGRTANADDTREVAELARVGATWWLESWLPWQTSRDEMLERIDQGHARI
jgi:alkanesulfonate monooxygenase SsuD/methylene tetrahydromethanopterin reductase-like flavin-dependent oxidoreductase (luciferase family)